MRALRTAATVVGALALTGCENVPLTRPTDPPVAGLELAAVVAAVILVVAVGTALQIVRPSQRLPRAPRALGAMGLAAAGSLVALVVAVQIGAAVRLESLGCAVAPAEQRPETLLQLRCTPSGAFGGDTGGLVPFLVVLCAVPVAAALVLAARLALAGFAVDWLAVIAAILGGCALVAAFDSASRPRTIAFVTAGVLFAIALVLAIDVMMGADSRLAQSSSSSGTTMSHRSRQSEQR